MSRALRNIAIIAHVDHGKTTFGDVLVRGKGACLLQEFIDEGGFAVIDVGDDGNIA